LLIRAQKHSRVKVVLSAKLKPGKRKRGKIVGEEELTTE